ncbi:MAG: hypothetical protein J5J00_12375 [Deltaproteobacteria bacterium]|nr:hypothetical protein [Deltaproteobacteria bacterium]
MGFIRGSLLQLKRAALFLLALLLIGPLSAHAQHRSPELEKLMPRYDKPPPEVLRLIEAVRSGRFKPPPIVRKYTKHSEKASAETGQNATMLAHIQGSEGAPIKKPLSSDKGKQDIGSAYSNIPKPQKPTKAPNLPRCSENRSIVAAKITDEPPKDLLDDLLVLSAAAPEVPGNAFGAATKVARYNAGSSDPLSLKLFQMGLKCLPFRARSYKQRSVQDMGKNALLNFDESPEKGKLDARISASIDKWLRE